MSPMPDRPKIPHDPTGRPRDEVGRRAKRWTRKLAEAGKFTSSGKRIPHRGRINEDDQPQ